MSLAPDQIDQFNQDGYLVCRNLASQETCAAMLTVANAHLAHAVAPLEYEADVGYPGAPASREAAGGTTVRRLRDAYQRDPVFRSWAEDPRIVGWLARRFDEPVYLTLAHHNCVMTKHPDYGTATGWHRDIRYWSFTRPDLVTVWLALGEETPSNGGLKLIPGSHRLDVGRHQLDDLDFLRPDVAENQGLFAQGIALKLAPGDAVFFHSGLFHSAGRNESRSVKYSVAFAYHASSNLPAGRSAQIGSVALSR